MEFKWRPKEENENKLNTEEAKFIFDQAEKQLKDTIETSQIIISRTGALVTITVAITSAIIGYAITNRATLGYNLIVTAYAGVFYLFLLGCFLAVIIKPTTYHTVGSCPKDLHHDNFFTEEYKDNRLLDLTDFDKSGALKVYPFNN